MSVPIYTKGIYTYRVCKFKIIVNTVTHEQSIPKSPYNQCKLLLLSPELQLYRTKKIPKVPILLVSSETILSHS